VPIAGVYLERNVRPRLNGDAEFLKGTSFNSARQKRLDWSTVTKSFVNKMPMVCCSLCGKVLFGVLAVSDAKWKTMSLSEDEVPLYALSNPGFVDYMRSSENAWYQSATCKAAPAEVQRRHTTLMSAAYQRILMEVKSSALQHLSCNDLGMNVKKKFGCYASGELYSSTLMDNALVTSELNGLTQAAHENLQKLLADAVFK